MHNVLYTTYTPMPYMIRKHILLPQPLDERIKLVARRDQKSEAEVIRELLEIGLETKQEQSVGQALRGLAKLGQKLGITGPTDLSRNIDKYLYEEK
jgi:predicted DNA-binding protein